MANPRDCTEDVISSGGLDAIKAEFGVAGMGNVLAIRGKQFFWEETRKDQPDWGIRGDVSLMLSDDMARRVGRFRIDGSGRVVRWPGLPQAWIRQWNEQGRTGNQVLKRALW